jgi:hypothetical protein
MANPTFIGGRTLVDCVKSCALPAASTVLAEPCRSSYRILQGILIHFMYLRDHQGTHALAQVLHKALE